MLSARFANSRIRDNFQYGSMKVQILQGDITKESTDCVINSSNRGLDLSLGAVSQALLAQAGPDLVTACRAQQDIMQRNGVVLTSAGNLNCKYVLHIDAQSKCEKWPEVIKQFLDLAARNQITSLSVPALGTGDMNLSPETMAKTIALSIKTFVDLNYGSSLKLIRLVVFRRTMVSTFSSAFEDSQLGFRKMDDASMPQAQSAAVNKSLLKKIADIQITKGTKAVYYTLQAEDFYCNMSIEYHYRIAESQFFRHLGSQADKYKIEKIEYVDNQILKEKFRAAQQNLKKTRGADMSYPVLAFHGTNAEAIKKICEGGFLGPGDVGFEKRVGSKFGDGVYFSEYPQYCMKYLEGSSMLLLCLVLTGKAYRCDWHMPGAKLIAGYDSHVSPKGKELIIFNTNFILPIYIVHCIGCEPVDLEPEVGD